MKCSRVLERPTFGIRSPPMTRTKQTIKEIPQAPAEIQFQIRRVRHLLDHATEPDQTKRTVHHGRQSILKSASRVWKNSCNQRNARASQKQRRAVRQARRPQCSRCAAATRVQLLSKKRARELPLTQHCAL